jgi:hypothetical protein
VIERAQQALGNVLAQRAINRVKELIISENVSVSGDLNGGQLRDRSRCTLTQPLIAGFDRCGAFTGIAACSHRIGSVSVSLQPSRDGWNDVLVFFFNRFAAGLIRHCGGEITAWSARKRAFAVVLPSVWAKLSSIRSATM